MIGPEILIRTRGYFLHEGNSMEKATRILVANTPKLMREVILATLMDQPDIEIIGEVANETEILPRVQATLPDLLVIALDETGVRPQICDRVLREYPAMRVLAVASCDDRTIYYWASLDIHSNDVEASPEGILHAVRNSSDIRRNVS